MKQLSALALTACFALIGCADASSPDPQAQADITAATNKVEANIDGMTCSGCSYEVTSAVKQVAGVSACTADPETGAVKVALEDSADAEATKAEVEKVIASLSDGKYKIKSITAVATEPAAESTTDESAPTQDDASDADPA